jgi:Kef-type K+ transport system membrane component KefB
MNALARITEGAPVVSGFFSLLDLALVVVLVIGAAMSVAERYVQIQAVNDKKLEPAPLSPFNYLAVMLVLVLAPILQALSPALLQDGNGQPFPMRGNAPAQNSGSESLYPTTLN